MLQHFLQPWLESIAQSLEMNDSERVAATRCPVTAELELQCDITTSQTSSNNIEIFSSKHSHLGLFCKRLLIYSTGVIVKDIWDFFSDIVH